MNKRFLINLSRKFDLWSKFNKNVAAVMLFGIVILPSVSLASITQDVQMLDTISTPDFDSFKVADKAKVPTSKKIYIAEISANFGIDWLSDFKGDTTHHYRNRTLRDYSDMMRKQIQKKLTAAGWNIVDIDEKGALKVKAHLKDLYINGPAKLTREHVLVKSIGHSSIVLTVNGLDNQPMFVIEDTRNAGGLTNHFIEADNAINFTWFNKLIENWATVFVAYLDLSTSEVNDKS